MLCKKGVLRNFAKFTGKHLCQRLLSNKDAGIGTSGQNLQNTSWRLLLSKSSKLNQKLYLLINIHVKRLFQFLKAPIFSCKFFLDVFDFLRFQLKFPKHLIKNLWHLFYIDETWHSYTLPKEDQKTHKSRGTPLWFCWNQHFSPEIRNFSYIRK